MRTLAPDVAAALLAQAGKERFEGAPRRDERAQQKADDAAFLVTLSKINGMGAADASGTTAKTAGAGTKASAPAPEAAVADWSALVTAASQLAKTLDAWKQSDARFAQPASATASGESPISESAASRAMAQLAATEATLAAALAKPEGVASVAGGANPAAAKAASTRADAPPSSSSPPSSSARGAQALANILFQRSDAPPPRPTQVFASAMMAASRVAPPRANTTIGAVDAASTPPKADDARAARIVEAIRRAVGASPASPQTSAPSSFARTAAAGGPSPPLDASDPAPTVQLRSVETHVPFAHLTLPGASQSAGGVASSPESSLASPRMDAPRDTTPTAVKFVAFDLEPASLGAVGVKMRLSKTSVDIEMNVSAPAAIDYLRDRRDALRKSIENAGVSVDALTVTISPASAPNAKLPSGSENEPKGFAAAGRAASDAGAGRDGANPDRNGQKRDSKSEQKAHSNFGCRAGAAGVYL